MSVDLYSINDKIDDRKESTDNLSEPSTSTNIKNDRLPQLRSASIYVSIFYFFNIIIIYS